MVVPPHSTWGTIGTARSRYERLRNRRTGRCFAACSSLEPVTSQLHIRETGLDQMSSERMSVHIMHHCYRTKELLIHNSLTTSLICTMMASCSSWKGRRRWCSNRQSEATGKEAFPCARSIGKSEEQSVTPDQRSDLVPAAVDSQQRPGRTSLDYRSCSFCISAEPAGRSEKRGEEMEKDQGAREQAQREGRDPMVCRITTAPCALSHSHGPSYGCR